MAMKKNLMTLLGIAFVVAIIATGLFYGLVVGKLDKAVKQTSDSVVVAAHKLKPGTVLASSDMKLAPKSGVDALGKGFSSPDQVAGLVVVTPVKAGEPLEGSELASKNSSRGAALGIPTGFRAVSIHVTDSTGVVRMLRPGLRVDVQLVYTRGGRPGASTTLRTVLQDLQVLRVEPESEATPGRPPLPVVTLLARPAEADALGIADAAARIRLLLRHPLDNVLTKRPSVVLAQVLRNPPKQSVAPSGLSASGRSAAPVRTVTGGGVR